MIYYTSSTKYILTTLLFLFFTVPVFAQDQDNDSVLDDIDNCSEFWNPDQNDLDSDGLGDPCDPTTKIISFSDLTPVGFAHEIDYLFNEDLSLTSLIDPSETFRIDSDSIRLLKPLNFDTKDVYFLKALQSTSSDSLDVIIFVDKTKKEIQVAKQKLDWTGDDIGPAYLMTTPYARIQSSYYDNLDIFSYWNPIAFDQCCIATDVDQDGDQDLIIADTRVNHKGYNLNIHQISEPVYLLTESPTEFRVKYNSVGNNMLFHTTQAFFEADLNGDERNEIVNLGEHYHALVPMHHAHYELNRSFMRSKGFVLGEHYSVNEYKMHRYYSLDGGEYQDQVSNILLDDETGDGFLSSYSAAIGDIDLDGDLDYFVASPIDESSRFNRVFDVLINDGEGHFTINRKNEDRYYTSEGYAHLVDLNGDMYPDLVFGGGTSVRDSSTLGYFLNDQNGHFDMIYRPIDKMNIALGARNIFDADLDQDGNLELIVYYSTGYGSNGNGLTEEDIPNLIRVYELQNGEFKDVSDQFFQDQQNEMNFYTQTGHMRYIDLDYDGDLDLVPRFNLEDPSFIRWDYPGNAYRGDWNDSKGFQYFAFDPASGQFQIVDLGVLSYDNTGGIHPTHLHNSFDFFDLDNDSYYEWVAMSDGMTITDPIYIEPIEQTINEVSVSSQGSDRVLVNWDDVEKANQYQFQVFRGDSTILDSIITSSQFTLTITDENYYDVRLRGKNILREGEWSEPFRIQNGQLTSVREDELPNAFSLSQNYPNPFNPTTTIQYSLPEATQVRVEVFSLLGQSAAVLLDGVQQAGTHTIDFDASDLSTGVYFYRLITPEFTQTRQMMLIK